MKKPSSMLGALVGLLLAPPLIAVFALGSTLAGLAFAPFDLFDWMARVLPGALITFGIDTMVSIIRGLSLGPTDAAAKLAEQAMAVGIAVGLSAVFGALFFGLMSRLSGKSAAPLGLIAGAVVGVPLLLISLTVNPDSAAKPPTAAVWIVGLSAAWGMALQAVYGRLAVPDAPDAPAKRVSAEAIDRRTFLIRVGGSAAVITVLGAGVSAWLGRESGRQASAVSAGGAALPEGLPNADDPVKPVPGTRPEITPVEDHYRIDIRTTPLVIAAEGYTLPFTTRIGSESEIVVKTLTLDEIRAYPATDAYITMSCISNPIGGDLISTTRWTGVSLQRLLADMDIPPSAAYLKIISGDGFDETVSLDLIAADERIMLAYDWDGQPLTAEHGFPLRIHIPDLYGMKQPKWITKIEFISSDEDGYWVRRGWDKVARVRTTSVIDTVYTDALVENPDSTIIPIGGIAWAGARGISAVEVRVDGGEWMPAQVRAPISDRTWQLWRFDWAFSEGSHTFEVRAFEADGTPQIEARTGVRPSGATGIHSVRERIAL
jgi:DMSO/TMAO reductase YedYZ molybdopterin-dependent catalytic subunit